ncbi:MAG: transposase [Acidimicrobiia bacterium]
MDGTIEVDETYLGGYAYGKRKGYKGNKSLILGAIERGGDVRLKVAVSRDGAAFGKFARQHFAPNAERAITDEWPPIRRSGSSGTMTPANTRSTTVRTNGSGAMFHTNSVESVWSLLKRSVVGSYHQLSKKNLPAYPGRVHLPFQQPGKPIPFQGYTHSALPV